MSPWVHRKPKKHSIVGSHPLTAFEGNSYLYDRWHAWNPQQFLSEFMDLNDPENAERAEVFLDTAWNPDMDAHQLIETEMGRPIQRMPWFNAMVTVQKPTDPQPGDTVSEVKIGIGGMRYYHPRNPETMNPNRFETGILLVRMAGRLEMFFATPRSRVQLQKASNDGQMEFMDREVFVASPIFTDGAEDSEEVMDMIDRAEAKIDVIHVCKGLSRQTARYDRTEVHYLDYRTGRQNRGVSIRDDPMRRRLILGTDYEPYAETQDTNPSEDASMYDEMEDDMPPVPQPMPRYNLRTRARRNYY